MQKIICIHCSNLLIKGLLTLCIKLLFILLQCENSKYILATIHFFICLSVIYLGEQNINESKFYFYFVTLAANYIGRHCNLCNINDHIYINFFFMF